MPNKKINALDVKVAVATDLMLVGDPATGTAYKSTLATLPLVPNSRTLTINGVAFDLSANRAWTIGTVTSVGLTMPSAFNVGSSPITSSGTIAVTGAGTTLQYIDGTGALQTFPTIMQANDIIAEVRNQSGATMTKGTIVYISGATGNKPLISKALASSDATSAQTFGLVQTDIANNGTGYIVIIGSISNLDTSALTEGQQLYLSGTTAGTWTTTKPYAPIHLVYVGIVIRSHPTLGTISVKIQNGYELDEIHNVAAQTPSNNDGLFYESSTSLWKNKTIASVLGYTPATSARLINTTSPLVGGGDLSADRTLSIPAATTSVNGYLTSTDWNTFNSKQAALTLTTTGTSGAATLVGATLNIPQYSGGGGSMAIGGAITSATAGSVLFAGTSGVLQQDNANFFWDDTNNRLGIGTATPTTLLHLMGSMTMNESGQAILFSNKYGAGANGKNIWIGNGGASTGVYGGSALLGSNNVSLGFNALLASTSGYGNVAVGTEALEKNTTGAVNTAVGLQALNANTTGTFNFALGYQSMFLNTTGSFNIAIGSESLRQNLTSNNNVGIGNAALRNTTAPANTGIGTNCLTANTSGQYNTSVGYNSMLVNTTANFNCSFGGFSLENNNAVGNSNFGYGGSNANTSGTYNSSLGYFSLQYNTTGSYNVALGFSAGSAMATGNNAITNNSIYIGRDTKALANNQTNQIVIGYQETGLGSNTTIIGNSSTITTAIRGRLLLGTTTDSGLYQADINGSTRVNQLYLRALNTAPATASSTGTLGEIRIDASYIYVCTATNTWVRTALTTW